MRPERRQTIKVGPKISTAIGMEVLYSLWQRERESKKHVAVLLSCGFGYYSVLQAIF